jgi:predicted PurR-regulated permease PerM
MDLILINSGIIVILIIAYIIWNLLQKVEKLENTIQNQEDYILKFYDLIKQSELKIKEIDSKQLFQSDDEVGFFFTNLKDIQESLSDYIKFIK